MRRNIAMFLIFTLIIGLFGCKGSTDKDLIVPVAFYYCNDLESKEDFSNIFVKELREGDGYQNDKLALLNQYVAGPDSENLTNPFPSDLVVLSVETNRDTTRILLDEQIAKLSGLELTLACTCLSLTLFDLYPCSSVEISANNSLLDGQESILITNDTLIFSDNGYPATED